MSDIVERLRAAGRGNIAALMDDAADEIERLRGLLIRIRDETAIDADFYDEICKLVGTG